MSGSLTTFAVLLTFLVGCAYGDCPPGYTRTEGYCFQVSEDYWTTQKTVTYDEAKEYCQHSLPPSGDQSSVWKANLIVLDNTEKLEALSRHIFEDLEKRTAGLVFWVGGEQHGNVWKWVDGTDINKKSYIFVPEQPPASGTNLHLYLTPADQINNRLYANAYTGVDLPSYVCEATRN